MNDLRFSFRQLQNSPSFTNGKPQRLRGVGISQNFLDVLGVRPLLGCLPHFRPSRLTNRSDGSTETRMKSVKPLNR
jgi:hypothetical protein